jgi:hypothetical protein
MSRFWNEGAGPRCKRSPAQTAPLRGLLPSREGGRSRARRNARVGRRTQPVGLPRWRADLIEAGIGSRRPTVESSHCRRRSATEHALGCENHVDIRGDFPSMTEKSTRDEVLKRMLKTPPTPHSGFPDKKSRLPREKVSDRGRRERPPGRTDPATPK